MPHAMTTNGKIIRGTPLDRLRLALGGATEGAVIVLAGDLADVGGPALAHVPADYPAGGPSHPVAIPAADLRKIVEDAVGVADPEPQPPPPVPPTPPPALAHVPAEPDGPTEFDELPRPAPVAPEDAEESAEADDGHETEPAHPRRGKGRKHK